MKSIKELYRIGTGPSSSHTMGPRKAAEMFVERHPDAASFKVTLYGSLAATGKGHMTDVAIIDTLKTTAPVEIIWQPKVFLPFHPNGMTFAAFDANLFFPRFMKWRTIFTSGLKIQYVKTDFFSSF